MKNDLVSIKDFAKIKGCSTQYVYRIMKTTLQPYVVLVDGQKYLKIDALLDYKTDKSSKLETNKVSRNKSKEVKPSASEEFNELKRINKRYEQIIDDLRTQLKEKDAQIIDLSNKITEQALKISELFEKNQTLFENNQKLQLNYQFLLTDDNNHSTDEIKKTSSIYEETEEEKPKPKGFFSKLFK